MHLDLDLRWDIKALRLHIERLKYLLSGAGHYGSEDMTQPSSSDLIACSNPRGLTQGGGRE
jgi:hypothetical protein